MRWLIAKPINIYVFYAGNCNADKKEVNPIMRIPDTCNEKVVRALPTDLLIKVVFWLF